MTARLSPQPWMTASATRAVMAALAAAGGEDCARFVGGCVRNTLMNTPVDDIDIATTLTPEAVIGALTAAGLKHVPTGLAHGTVTAIAEGRPFEITTLRRDVTTDGRNATVAYTTDWTLDAARRDFTFNALYADLDGVVFDPVGQGVKDAAAGRVVFVGDPETRIREDYLRILRFFRFYAWYGRGEADAAALAACEALAQGMGRLSAERVSRELLKLLAAAAPLDAMRLMALAGVLAVLAPEAARLDRLGQVVKHTTDPMLRLAALLPDDVGAARRFADRLRLSGAQKDRLAAALEAAPRVDADMTLQSARSTLYAIGPQAYTDRLILNDAASARLRDLASDWTRPVLPIGGDDVMAVGIAKGPRTGEILRAVEAWWIDQDFGPSRTACLEYLKKTVAESLP